MDFAALAALIVKYGAKFGPRVRAALPTLLTLLERNPQVRASAGDVFEKLKQTRKPGQVSSQIALIVEISTAALTEQTLTERQDIARVWLQRARAYEMAWRAADLSPRKASKVRKAEVAIQVDALLAEVIETVGKWADG